MANPFYQRDIISIKDFSREELDHLFETATRLEGMAAEARHQLGHDRILGVMFFEPSTRTRLSFEAAMQLIGGGVVGFAEPHTTSVEKGENLADTVRAVEALTDLLVLRHPREGAARYAAEVAEKPVINAGSGTEEHPTQAMLDLYTILREKGRIGGLRVAVVGDLKYGRTVYSLLYGLAKYGSKIYLVSPPELRIREEALYELSGRVEVEESRRLEEVVGEADVLYITRIQRERFPDPHEYEKVRGSYVVDSQLLEQAREGLIVMHPLPRVGEIRPEVDETPYARYFRQIYYGRLVRAALLSLILNPQV
jgi:aspartate carbamoyltransferase catalytic subunit